MNRNKKFISFFSGALGLDLGLEAAGYTPLAANEIDAKAAETIRLNRPALKLYDCDIRSLTRDLLLKDLSIDEGELFAIVGGPPCQAFSTAGRRLGLNDDRGNVFLHFIDLVKGLRPKYAVFENVRGLLSAPLVHRPHNERGQGFPPLSKHERPGGALLTILQQLEDAGYTVSFNLYNTANFGVPQVRERLIFFASREGSTIPYLVPTHSEKPMGSELPWVTLREAVGALKERGVLHHSQFPERRLRYYKLLKSGQNWRDLPEALQREAMGKSFECGGGRTGFYRRLSWDKPSPTLVTSPTMPATDLCHPEELRPLAVEEYAAIQTFPNDYRFAGALIDQYRQIGNAVPCLFGQVIGQHLTKFDVGSLKELTPVSSLSRYVRTDDQSWREGLRQPANLFN